MGSAHCVTSESIAGKYLCSQYAPISLHKPIKTSPAANELVVRVQISAEIPKNVSFSISNL